MSRHHLSRPVDHAPVLAAAIVTAAVDGQRLLTEPGLLLRLVGRATCASVPVRRTHRPVVRISGLPPSLELELRRRARDHGLPFGTYVVAVLGQLAHRAPSSASARAADDAEQPRGQPPNLHLVLGVRAGRQSPERDIHPIPEMAQ